MTQFFLEKNKQSGRQDEGAVSKKNDRKSAELIHTRVWILAIWRFIGMCVFKKSGDAILVQKYSRVG